MILITGGAYQGKTEYAKRMYPELLEKHLADGATCSPEEIFSCGVLTHFHLYIRRMLKEEHPFGGLTPEVFAEKVFAENENLVLITDEIGCGIVPVDAFERKYRETTGRICTALAAKSREVIRVYCGAGMKIKG